jgi:hypothetical protein
MEPEQYFLRRTRSTGEMRSTGLDASDEFAATNGSLYGRVMHQRTFHLVFAVVLSFASVAAAQSVRGTDDPDYKEIVAYRLTMPTVEKMGQATRKMAEAIKNDPRFKRQQALEAELDKLEAKEEPTEAAMIHGMMKSGLVEEVPKELAASVNMENVKFVAEHEKELEAFGKEMQALRPKK